MAQRLIAVLAVASALACQHGPAPSDAPAPTAPLPTAGMAGQEVAVTPLTLLAADDSLPWREQLTPRRVALDHADSLLGALLTERSPEVTWILPPALRQSAARAPDVLTPPDQLATAILRGGGMSTLPDPLRSQLRALAAVAGGRYVLIPAALIFERVPGQSGGRAELVLVLADVRTGQIGWRTVANAVRDDPWSALEAAIKSLVPGLP